MEQALEKLAVNMARSIKRSQPSEVDAKIQAEAEELKAKILSDAEQHAQQIIDQTKQEMAEMKKKAEAEIEQWWIQKRAEDQAVTAEAQKKGYDEGYRTGKAEAEQAVQQRYQQMISEANEIIEQARQEKERRIAESEAFLIELSCEIAEKIISKQLSLESEWKKDLVKQMLSKKREQGLITLCVNPKSYGLMQDARDELQLVLGSNSELQILPDISVKDDGCIIRSEYGSIDARIDTQLTEIKQKLLQASTDSEALQFEQQVSGK